MDDDKPKVWAVVVDESPMGSIRVVSIYATEEAAADLARLLTLQDIYKYTVRWYYLHN